MKGLFHFLNWRDSANLGSDYYLAPMGLLAEMLKTLIGGMLRVGLTV